ncbi:MAG: hypothetical protein KGM49_09875 [Sphingomonadales bacterium]|nr:hypothetical protein [Sphingomonadales bacterium]
MVKQQRKATKSKPITANPLFPAVAALWCAAALGGASLALRSSLLEALVIKSRIDLIVPAAAPPLGITARILIALILAALGAVLGTVLARRIARPKASVRERKRGARSTDSAEPRFRARDSHPDAPARRPISAHEELGEDIMPEVVAAEPGQLLGRRRALTMSEEPASFIPHELAPLPGGQPQILDLAGAELDQIEPQSFAIVSSDRPATEAPDLNAYEDAEPEEVATGDRAPGEPDAPDWNLEQGVVPSQPVAAAGPAADSDFDAPRQIFQNVAESAEDTRPALDDHLKAGRQVFGVGPVEPQEPSARQIFGQGTTESQVATEFVESLGYKTKVFDTAPAQPLFAARQSEARGGQSEMPPAEPTVEASNETAFAAAEPLPPIADLGMTDLAARLQDSMKRRRAARAAGSPASVPESAPSETRPPLGAISPPMAPLAPAATGPVAPLEPAPVIAAPSFAPLPVFAPSPVEPDSAAAVAIVPPLPPTLPVALRPIAFDDLADDEDDTLASLLPPRHRQAEPTPVVRPKSQPNTPVPVAPEALEETAGPVDEIEPAAEEGYASLLRLNPHLPRNPFVRIEEPEEGSGTVEPVVIFPGQAPRVTLGVQPLAPVFDVAPVESRSAEEPVSFRRFDAPTSASAGQAVASNPSAPEIDHEEAERALRAALSNLQRISGAA